MTNLKEHHLYRIAYNADDPKLRGQPVSFHGWLQRPWDIRRAIVRTIAGDEWLVTCAIIIPF